FWSLAHRMRTPLRLDNGQALDVDRKPGSEEYLDLLHAGSRVPLSEVRRHPGGHVFEPPAPVRVQPARSQREGAPMDVAPAAVIAQLEEILAEPADDPAFPYRLISRRTMEIYNSTGDHLPALARADRMSAAFMHPDDLARLGVTVGERLRIASAHDWIEATAAMSADVPPGVVSMAHARELEGSGTTGRLVTTARDFEALSAIPRQSAIPVSVHRAPLR